MSKGGERKEKALKVGWGTKGLRTKGNEVVVARGETVLTLLHWKK